MRQFLIDELSDEEMANIDSYLKRTLKVGPMEGIFWLAVPDDLLGEAQQGHEDCGPFYFGVELDRNLGRNKFIAEFLVRSESNLHCSCIGYATNVQRDFLLKFIDTMLVEEQIKA